MLSNQVQAECPKCNNRSAADAFVLDYLERRMVCPGCFKKARKPSLKEQVAKQEKVVKETKPIGWDKEDEYLVKISKLKKEQDQAQFKRIPGTNQVSCKCMKCKYVFKYDHFKKIPVSCPYCNQDIPRFKTFNLLKFYK